MTLRPILFLLSAICFGLGISLPLMRFEKLWVFVEEPSLIQMVGGLWAEQSFGLAIIIACFSIVFPVLKLLVGVEALYISTNGKKSRAQKSVIAQKIRTAATALSKWSMMDVLLVAIVVFAAKTSSLANAVALPGIWFFAASAILSAIASFGLVKR